MMRALRCVTSVAVLGVFLATLVMAEEPMVDRPLAPRLAGLDVHHHQISTTNEDTQYFFNQGMVLAFGFNHAEAERSFREAARLDPECAICWWGVAWVLGTNYNLPMLPEAVPVAWEAVQKAQALASHASEKEQAYIAALAKRYGPEVVEDRSALERAFSDAMREVSRAYPDDLDAAIIFAESLMNLIPWDLWTPDGEPRPEAAEALAVLESILERDPDHPQALHLYIHAVEKVHPRRAEQYADRLRGLVPGAGHLVHMPSHIYIRVGRYHESVQVNQEADAADEAYVAQCHAQGIYPLAYHSHNVHFITYSASMQGRSALAIEASQKLARRHQEQHELMREADWGSLQYYYSMPLYALVRFGRWQKILARPEPAQDLPYAQVAYHYARGLAALRTGDRATAETALAKVASYAADPEMEELSIWGINTFRHVFQMAREVLAGEIAAAAGDWETAISHLEEAVSLEDGLLYQEPPDWQIPVRQNLGAVLLAAGRPAEAEKVYREDLEIYPANGWSLFGLVQALEAQEKDATAARAMLAEAWQHADVELTASRF